MEATPSARPAGASQKLPAAVREAGPRTAIEPVIGHLKAERRVSRNHLAHRAESDFHADVRGGRRSGLQVRPDDASYSDVFDGRTRRHTYRFFSLALAVLPRTAVAEIAGFDALAASYGCGLDRGRQSAPAYVNRLRAFSVGGAVIGRRGP